MLTSKNEAGAKNLNNNINAANALQLCTESKSNILRSKMFQEEEQTLKWRWKR